MTIPLTRRTVLVSGAFGATTWLLGCRTARTEPLPADAAAPGACAATEDNIEGPFFKPGAPRRAILAKPDAPGTRLRIVGRVLSASCAPLTGALLDVWHANHRGAYDSAGFEFRTTLETNARGGFALQTIVPGRYLNGNQYRPAHVHFKLHAAGHQSLTTQLYFEGDPYNRVDAFVRRSLIVPVERAREGVVMRYDFVLVPA